MVKSRKLTDEFNSLQKMGFELASPQDEFSYQPDSGSSTGGLIGKQEYGIDTDYDAQNREEQEETQKQRIRAESTDALIEANGNENGESLVDEDLNAQNVVKISDFELKKLVSQRLSQHPRLRGARLSVSANNGEVTILGTVKSEASKMLVHELVEAVSAVSKLRVDLDEESRDH